MGFPTSHQQGCASLLTFPRWGSYTQICHFSQRFRQKSNQKPLKVQYATKFHCLKASNSKVVAQSIIELPIKHYQHFGRG